MTKKIFLLLFLFTLLAPNFAFAVDPIPGDPPLADQPINEDEPPPFPDGDPNNPDAALIDRANADAEAAPATPPKSKNPESVKLVNPIGGTYEKEYKDQTDAKSQGNTNIQTIIGNAIQVTLRLLGAITLAVFFYGGFMWLTSAGNAEKVGKGTKTMMYAVIGLFIIFGAYGILTTIISGITNSPQVGGGPSAEDGDFATCTGIQKEQKCKDAASIGCVWAVLQIPDGEKLDACVPQNEKADTCINFGRACISALEDDPQGEINCQNAATSCKTN